MRLLELVPSLPCGAWRAPPTEESPEEPAPVPCQSPENHRRWSSSGSATSWQPSLGSISEDGVVSAKVAAAARGKVKGKEKTALSAPARRRPVARASSRRKRDEFRQYQFRGIVPTFTPTAFLF